jgi:transcriptional regulatory protein RtcR
LIDLELSRYDQIAQRFSREQTQGVAVLKSGRPDTQCRFQCND